MSSLLAAGLCFVVVMACLQVPAAFAQLPLPQAQSSQETDESTWQPPELVDLPLEWWTQFDVVSPVVGQSRFDRLLANISDRIRGLDAENLVAAQTGLSNLENLVRLLYVPDQSGDTSRFEPVLTQQEYTLDDVLAMQAQWRSLNKEFSQVNLQVSQTQRQLELLRQRRDSVLRQYQASARESPERILSGISRISARVEFQLNLKQVDGFNLRLKKIDEQMKLNREQQTYARAHLTMGETKLADVSTLLSDARANYTARTQNVAAVQKLLLDAMSAPTINQSLQLLRTQQLTRASAEATLAELTQELVRRKADWHRYRAGVLPGELDQTDSITQAQQLTQEALKQVEVWAAISQGALLSSPPGASLNEVKNFELARDVARDTVVLIERIQDTSDDLLLVQEILTTDTISSRSGLSKAWAKTKLSASSFFSSAGAVLDYKLFSIGDGQVTPGGLFKLLLIIVFAYAISWLIRHLLDRATGNQQFARSPAIYTLGRLLHYIIMLIGVFAALGSIGMDFTNFALIAGALSVGIGFGLQAIVNNFVSGLILLFEGSLRIGDYIELDSGLAGIVKEINTRATIVNSNDGVDVVVPNSELVTTKLTNWTLRESVGRLRFPFGVAYGSDKEVVRDAAMKAATETEFVLLNMKGREPQVRLVNFGDSALEFEMLAWVNRQGIRRPHRVRASFLWALETCLTEAGIEIPFPQRDVHIIEPEKSKPARRRASKKTQPVKEV